MKNPFRSTRIFLGEMVGELQKATWPTKAELRDSTVVVVLAAVILGLFTSISDFSLYQVVALFTDWVSQNFRHVRPNDHPRRHPVVRPAHALRPGEQGAELY